MNSIVPEWPVADHVQAFFTQRSGGVSAAPYDSLNLGDHVGDDPERVKSNRSSLNVPANPFWLTQVHSNHCVNVDVMDEVITPGDIKADASVTRTRGTVLAIMVADCLPILLSNRQGSVIGVAHAGWRGLANGVIDAVIDEMQSRDLYAWLGPAIGQCHYRVGDDVRAEFPDDRGFNKADGDKFDMDLAAIATYQLTSRGVNVYNCGLCTHCEQDRFFSYRRDGVTGRMGGFLWMKSAGHR